jgi:hypothetical protein
MKALLPATPLLLAASLSALAGQLAADETRPETNTDRPVVRVVYFIPTDRTPEPDFQARLDRVMTHVRYFYQRGMEQNGYGKMTFELDLHPNGALRIYPMRGKGPTRDYGRDAAKKVLREVREGLARYKLNMDHETIIVFQVLLEWRGDKAVEMGPFVGGGGPRCGYALVFDDARLDPRLLSSRAPGGYFNGPCSLGKFNTMYIGGAAHELGHAFGLPHDCERDSERPRRGVSIMGTGNYTYGQEQRGEGKGAFLSAASTLPLSVHPLFTGKRRPLAIMTCRLTELKATPASGELLLTGQLEGGPRVIGLVAHNDPQGDQGEYKAVGWICRVDADGNFRLVIGELKPGAYDLRLTAYGESGDWRRFTFRYQVDQDRQPDVRPFAEKAK